MRIARVHAKNARSALRRLVFVRCARHGLCAHWHQAAKVNVIMLFRVEFWTAVPGYGTHRKCVHIIREVYVTNGDLTLSTAIQGSALNKSRVSSL